MLRASVNGLGRDWSTIFCTSRGSTGRAIIGFRNRRAFCNASMASTSPGAGGGVYMGDVSIPAGMLGGNGGIFPVCRNRSVISFSVCGCGDVGSSCGGRHIGGSAGCHRGGSYSGTRSSLGMPAIAIESICLVGDDVSACISGGGAGYTGGKIFLSGDWYAGGAAHVGSGGGGSAFTWLAASCCFFHRLYAAYSVSSAN